MTSYNAAGHFYMNRNFLPGLASIYSRDLCLIQEKGGRWQEAEKEMGDSSLCDRGPAFDLRRFALVYGHSLYGFLSGALLGGE